MSITLYDLGTADPDLRFSPFCWRAKMSLAHKGLSWQEVACLFTEKDRLPQPNSATVPIVVDDGSVVSDSWKIAEYLDRKYPDNPLFDGYGMPSAAFIEALCAANGYDLTPGLESRASCPEAIWQAARWWHEFQKDQQGAEPIRGMWHTEHFLGK